MATRTRPQQSRCRFSLNSASRWPKDGGKRILSWHTLLSLPGLNGFLDWFGVQSVSPFGDNLWFLTLLWGFYLIYPILARANDSKLFARLGLGVGFIGFSVLHFVAPMPHVLWLTVLGFVAGAYAGRHAFSVPPVLAAVIGVGSVCGMLALNVWTECRVLNYFLILTCSLACVGHLLNGRAPARAVAPISLLNGCVLEIYFIHAYVSFRPSFLQPVVGFLLSMALMVPVAFMLSALAEWLRRQAMVRN